jgi:hypothetical protein
MCPRFDDELIAHIVEAATAAPSIHNSQPWQFEGGSRELRLHGAPDRALPVADPTARALYLSCGAALFNARLAASIAGLDTDVALLPHPEYPPDVLAVLRPRAIHHPTSADWRLYDAIWRRHTDRRPFSPRPIPRVLIAGLQKSAEAEQAGLRLLTRAETSVVLGLAADAGRALVADRAHQDELRQWMGEGPVDGVPARAMPVPPQHSPSPVRDADFLAAAAHVSDARGAYERHPQIAVLITSNDEPEDWLRAGQALQRVLLIATLNGLSASFLYQVIESDDMRDDGARAWPWPEHPQMIIRLGYGSGSLPTPRRSVTDVLQPARDLRLPAVVSPGL